MIKVIKRNTALAVASPKLGRAPRTHPATVTVTVNDWIAESRRNKLDNDASSRKTIAGWAAEADN